MEKENIAMLGCFQLDERRILEQQRRFAILC